MSLSIFKALSTVSAYVCNFKADIRLLIAGRNPLSNLLAFLDSSSVICVANLESSVNLDSYFVTVILPWIRFKNSNSFCSLIQSGKYLSLNFSWNNFHVIGSCLISDILLIILHQCSASPSSIKVARKTFRSSE